MANQLRTPRGSERFEALDIPARRAILLGGRDDPINVVVGCRACLEKGSDVTQCRLEPTALRFDYDRTREVSSAEHLAGMSVQLELCIGSKSEDSVRAAGIRRRQIGKRTDLDLEPMQLGDSNGSGTTPPSLRTARFM
jgi:hypothetical protein